MDEETLSRLTGSGPFSRIFSGVGGTIMEFAILAAVAWIILRITKGVGRTSFSGPALVVTKFQIGKPTDAIPLNIEARIAGVAAWILSHLKLETSYVLQAEQGGVHFRYTSLVGRSNFFIPFGKVSLVDFGFARDASLLSIALLAIFESTLLWLFGTIDWPYLLISLIVGIGLLALFYLSERLYIYVRGTGAEYAWLKFTSSIVEGAEVNIVNAEKAANILIAKITTPAAKK